MGSQKWEGFYRWCSRYKNGLPGYVFRFLNTIFNFLKKYTSRLRYVFQNVSIQKFSKRRVGKIDNFFLKLSFSFLAFFFFVFCIFIFSSQGVTISLKVSEMLESLEISPSNNQTTLICHTDAKVCREFDVYYFNEWSISACRLALRDFLTLLMGTDVALQFGREGALHPKTLFRIFLPKVSFFFCFELGV